MNKVIETGKDRNQTNNKKSKNTRDQKIFEVNNLDILKQKGNKAD